MASELGVYNPIFYAQEALVQLENALGLANTVHMGFDAERKSAEAGDIVSIRRPGTFEVNSAPATAEDVKTETVNMTLDQWKEVKFKLTDKDLAISEDRIIQDHIRPAAYALANNIDAALVTTASTGMAVTAGSVSGDFGVVEVVNVHEAMFDAQVPMDDTDNLFFMVNGTLQADILKDSAFTQHAGSGDLGVSSQVRGAMGQRFGFNFFANQNAGSTHTISSAITGDYDVDSASPAVKGDTSIRLDGTSTPGGTIQKGDIMSLATSGVAGQGYVVTADVTGAADCTVSFEPPLKADSVAAEVVTFSQAPTGKKIHFAHHRNALALAMAPLPMALPNSLGARVASVADPRTGLSIRSRMYYVGNSSEVHVALDVLYATRVLDPRLMCRISEV